MDSPAYRLHLALKAAGVPVDGVSYPPLRIDFADSATDEQRQAGRQIAAGFDLRRRQPRGADLVLAEVAALDAQARESLLARMIAEALLADPGLARRAGVGIESDEPVPEAPKHALGG